MNDLSAFLPCLLILVTVVSTCIIVGLASSKRTLKERADSWYNSWQSAANGRAVMQSRAVVAERELARIHERERKIKKLAKRNKRTELERKVDSLWKFTEDARKGYNDVNA